MRRFLFFSFLTAIFMVAACTDAPRGVLSSQEMEDVLFDYHLTQGVIEQLTEEEKGENAQRYVDAVFAKHGVTEQQFDSSMVWYFRDGRQLKDIYANVHKRFEAIDKELKLKNSSGSYAALPSHGDTANIWPGRRTLILRNTPLLCCERFNIMTDTTFHHGDKFLFVMENKFTKGMSEEHDHYINVALTLQYADGTVGGDNRTVDLDGTFQYEIVADKEKDLKRMYGYFYYKAGRGGRKMCSIRNIALIRMHDKSLQQSVVTDTLVLDSIETDTIVEAVPDTARRLRMSPEQLHEQVAPSSRIEIRKAPEVRTRNSYGVRRKKKTE